MKTTIQPVNPKRCKDCKFFPGVEHTKCKPENEFTSIKSEVDRADNSDGHCEHFQPMNAILKFFKL